MQGPVLFVVGTRPEAIKLIPIYKALLAEGFEALLCATFQHNELLQQVFTIFEVEPDFRLDVMKKDQDLFYLTSVILERCKDVYTKVRPKLVCVHGDTTTTFAASLAAFYLHIPVAHVEAGLRTGNMRSPFPEEMNRKVVGQFADYHFAPTAFSTAHLLAEGVRRDRIFCTGNTIVDALHWIKNRIETGAVSIPAELKKYVASTHAAHKKLVLLTAHRRESFNGGLARIFNAVKDFLENSDEINIVVPLHPNPHVVEAFNQSGLREHKNIFVTPPLVYSDLVYLLTNSAFVVTDSGGIQEEAVSLGKPVIVLRDVTERWEGVWEGAEKLVGTDSIKIKQAMSELVAANEPHAPSTVYGDGNAVKRIVAVIRTLFDTAQTRNEHHVTEATISDLFQQTGALL